MAGLKKPLNCNCGSVLLHREYDPERWICDECSTVVRSRQKKPDTNSCRECGANRDSKPFKDKKNLCLDCYNEYMIRWRKNNQGHWREYRSKPEVKSRLRANVRRAIQQSPKSFIRNLYNSLTKQSNNNNRRFLKANGVKLELLLTYDDLLSLYESQHGLCALTQLPMTHQFNDLCSISVDRIDSKLGYVSGNIQLVCKWVNLAKQKHTNAEFVGMLDKLRSVFNVI